jgi:DNA-binding response OmpR family regulator
MGDHGNSRSTASLEHMKWARWGRQAAAPARSLVPFRGQAAEDEELAKWRESNRVLIVDDDPHALAYVDLILSAQGLSTATAPTGEEALAFVSRSRPGAVVLDLQLPGLSGHDTLCELLREDPALPVIVLTQTRRIEEVVSCMRSGASDYVLKPCNPDKLVKAARSALTVATLRSELERLEGEDWQGGFEVRSAPNSRAESRRDLEKLHPEDYAAREAHRIAPILRVSYLTALAIAKARTER